MLSLVACALTLAQAPIDQPQRLRTILPNGAVLLVERRSSAKSLSLQLFISARAGGTFAERHLLEHLAALGNGDLDVRLESQGAFLKAQTLREATVYEFDLPQGKFALGLSALHEILTPRKWSTGQVRKEADILKLEDRTRNSAARVSDAAWLKAYGPAGASAFDLTVPTPERMAQLQHSALRPENLGVVAIGNIELDATTAAIERELKTRIPPSSKVEPSAERKPGGGGSTEAGANGRAVAVPVPSYRNPVTAAVLSAALALASEQRESYVTYTPSSKNGLVILGSTQDSEIKTAARAEELFALGKLMGKQWVQERIAGFYRGLLLVQERDLRPETLRENIDAMTLEQFREALARFISPTAVTVTGRTSSSQVDTRSVEYALPKVSPPMPAVVEVRDASEDKVSLQCLVALPSLSAAERGLLAIAVAAIPRGTDHYPRREMMAVTGGAPVETVLAPDHVRLSLSVAPSRLSDGLALMESLLRSPSLRPEDLHAPSRPGDPWQIALQRFFFAPPKFTEAAVREVCMKVFRPERVTLAAGGNFEAGLPTAQWQTRMSAWHPARLQRGGNDYSNAQVFSSTLHGVQTIDIASELAPKSFSLYPRLLATFALGGGKGSSLFRVVRHSLGISYRQEAVLSPTPEALETRLLIETDPAESDLDRVQSALLKDIDGWSDADKLRALGIADAVINRQNEFSPFYLSGFTPVLSDLSGRTLISAYWQMKTGQAWVPDQIFENLRNISLEDLKEAAKQIVNGQVRVLKG
ncbi:MAG: hypothetical protein ACAH95_18785 [Fimbriimonas sp.]